MRANMKAHGYMDEKQANLDLKMNLDEIKRLLETVLNMLNLLMGRINFEEGEIDKYIELRDAILGFRTVEVKLDIPTKLMIQKKILDEIQEIYGVKTEAGINRVINEIIADDLKEFKKIDTGGSRRN